MCAEIDLLLKKKNNRNGRNDYLKVVRTNWLNLTGRQHLTCSSGLVQGVLLHDCSCAVLCFILVPQGGVLWKREEFNTRVTSQFSYFVTIRTQTALIDHHLLCVPHPASASAGPSSAVLASQFHVQTRPPHQHSTVATNTKIKRDTFKKKKKKVHACVTHGRYKMDHKMGTCNEQQEV